MSKFDSRKTERLYNDYPEDSLGQSIDGLSWYGLYPSREGGGSIVIEDTYGNVSRVDYVTTAALHLAWSELETEQDLNHNDGDLIGEWRETFDIMSGGLVSWGLV